MSTTFTINDLIKAYDLIYPPLHFALSKHIEKDDIYRIKAQTIGFIKYPEFALFHPCKLQEIAEGVPVRLIPLSERESEYKMIHFDDLSLLYLLTQEGIVKTKNSFLPPGACS